MTPLEMTTSAQPSLDREGLGETVPELDVGEAEQGGGVGGLGEHLAGHVDADDGAACLDVVGGDEAVEPGTGADVDDTFAGFDRAERERVADAGERFDGAVGQGVDDRGS